MDTPCPVKGHAARAAELVDRLADAGLKSFTRNGAKGVRLDTHIPSKEGQRSVRYLLLLLGGYTRDGWIIVGVNRPGTPTHIYLSRKTRQAIGKCQPPYRKDKS